MLGHRQYGRINKLNTRWANGRTGGKLFEKFLKIFKKKEEEVD